jgi:hypothetical protein
VSELLDRIVGEIRGRLAATRAAALEHERLEAALSALESAGATRTVRGRAAGKRAPTPAGGRSSAAKGEDAARASAERGASEPATRASRRAGGQVAARKRAPRGANREAVLRAVSERPGASARELAAVTDVRGGTLYALLRTLTERGELDKLALPGGQIGYRPAVSPTAAAPSESAPAPSESAAAPSEPASAPSEPAPAAPIPPATDEGDEADTAPDETP